MLERAKNLNAAPAQHSVVIGEEPNQQRIIPDTTPSGQKLAHIRRGALLEEAQTHFTFMEVLTTGWFV